MSDAEGHHREIRGSSANWERKPLLREIYKGFHEVIASQLAQGPSGSVVELGSGVADIRGVIPDCVRTDLVHSQGIDRVENAYALSFGTQSVSNLILFDVFHHLQYPGAALREFSRVLASRGRVILFEPCLSALGWVVYGTMHKEPVAVREPIQWDAPVGWNPARIDYYAAQGNATRIFLRREIDVADFGWNVITTKRLSAISYVASGGYSGPQLYPAKALPIMRTLDRWLDRMPRLFATRLLVVLERMDDAAFRANTLLRARRASAVVRSGYGGTRRRYGPSPTTTCVCAAGA